MKNIKDNIPHILGNMRLKKSLSLTDSEKHTLLQRIITTEPKVAQPVLSPFVRSFEVFFRNKIQYALYALPVILIAVLAANSGTILNDFNQTKGEIETAQNSIEAKMSLSKAEREMYALKLATDDSAKKDALVSQVVTHSQDVRTKVAAMTEEQQIPEAKTIALQLEAMLKAGQPTVSAPSAVTAEIIAATELRMKLEKKEVVSLAFNASADNASPTAASIDPQGEIRTKIDALKKDIDALESTEVTADLIKDANSYVAKAEEYLAAGNIESAVISFQASTRIVADIKQVLVK